jgi:thiamine transporter
MNRTKEASAGIPARAIAEAGMLVALAVVLNQIQLLPLPQGGSITPGASLPIWIIAWRHGTRVGVLAGMALGTILAFFAPRHWHVLQVLLDYPLAFGMLGLAGALHNPVAGALLASFVRIGCHALSGMLFFREFVPGGWVPWTYVIAYNAIVVLPETAIGLALWGAVPDTHRRGILGHGLMTGGDDKR